MKLFFSVYTVEQKAIELHIKPNASNAFFSLCWKMQIEIQISPIVKNVIPIIAIICFERIYSHLISFCFCEPNNEQEGKRLLKIRQ